MVVMRKSRQEEEEEGVVYDPFGVHCKLKSDPRR